MFNWDLLWKGWRLKSQAASEAPEQRLAAINQGNIGQNGLRRLVVHDESSRVRAAAAKRLLDLVLLRQVLEQDPAGDVVAAARARYRQLLAGGDSLSLDYRLAAVRACNDRQILAHVARSAREDVLRAAVLPRLTNLQVLAEVAQHDPSEGIRRAADDHLAKLRAKGQSL